MGKLCQYESCTLRANFNFDGEKSPLFCDKHKTNGMVNVYAKKCQHIGCSTSPRFNFRGGKHGKFCAKHKEHGMIDIFCKTCKYSGCDVTYPIYNFFGESKGIFCKIHKKEGMVDVKNPRCKHGGCEAQPRFNTEGEKRGMYCYKHKLEGMVNVVSKEKCLANGCSKRPTYNTVGERKPIYCRNHKNVGMVDVVSRRCHYVHCFKQPTFNYEGNKTGMFCNEHKKDGMMNVTGKRCINEGCDTIPYHYSRYGGYCLYCFIHLFPDDNRTTNYKIKERHVTDFVMSQFQEWTIIHDKKIADGCSMRRPDLMIDFGEYVVVIEIDEDQHSSYDLTCENKRLMEISRDVGHRPMVLIRFNPDKYLAKDGHLISSCWRINKLGVQVVSDKKKGEWESRLSTLKDVILEQTTKPHEKTVDILHLFYDGYTH